MTTPTPAPTFEITFTNGETRRLQYGFRAFKELGISPFRPKDLLGYLGTDLSELDVDKAAAWIRAGTLWEHASDQARAGEAPLTVDWVIDHMDLATFMATFDLSIDNAGLKSDGDAAKDAPPDPSAA